MNEGVSQLMNKLYEGYRKEYLGVVLVIVLLGTNPSRDQMVLNGMGKGEIVVPRGRNVPILHQGVMQVPIEGLLDLRNVSDLGNAAHTDLFPPLVV